MHDERIAGNAHPALRLLFHLAPTRVRTALDASNSERHGLFLADGYFCGLLVPVVRYLVPGLVLAKACRIWVWYSAFLDTEVLILGENFPAVFIARSMGFV
jgi:hypothetical protein